MSAAVPPALAALPTRLREMLRVSHQARPEDLSAAEAIYRKNRIQAELQSFFTDVPERLARAHLAICRAGASTVAELTVLGRPSILVPLPGSIDADQKNNALVIANAGAGWIMEQATLSPISLATRLSGLFDHPTALTGAASAAKSLGKPDAVERLADLAEGLAGGKTK